MTISVFGSGTQAATIATEHFLASINQAGVYTCHVDLVNMAAGDITELRIYEMILTGGTQRVLYVAKFEGAQPSNDLIARSDALDNDLTDGNSLRFSLLQSFGTGRNYPWKVLKHA